MPLSKPLPKKLKNPLIAGTILLTAAGVISRIIGFFYKIFLSRAIGAESLGLYHLTFPVLALGMSLTSSGIQTALSRYVAEERDSPRRAMRYFYGALLLSCGMSLIFGGIIRQNAPWIASEFLGDSRCAPLLSIMVYCLIPACVHSCINGYYYGLQKATVPSLSQLAEQIARVGGVYLMYQLQMERKEALTAVHAIWGTVIGEFFGLLISGTAILLHTNQKKTMIPKKDDLSLVHAITLLCSMAVPLTFNRVIINICTSVENLLIPQRLGLSGLSQSEALSVYGVLSGMVMSVIMFPGVLTGSISVLLLPSVSEAKAHNHMAAISHTIKKAIRYGLLLGFSFTALFLLTGGYIGERLFDNALAGEFIRRLSWICPFMYISGLLSSILHGLGKPKTVLFINLLSCLIRIVFIYCLVPRYGIGAYLWSMLLSQVFCATGSMIALRGYYDSK